MADISKIKTLDGTTYDIKDAKAFRPGTKLFSTNSFAPDDLKSFYYSKIDNAFYASDKRFTTTFTVDSTQYNTSNLFDGSYEGGLDIPDGKSGVITIDYSGQPGSKFPGYPYGFIYLSFYAGRLPKTITGRVYNNYASQGVGWKDLSFQKLDSNGYIWYAQQSYYGLQTLEITIIANDSSTYHVTRPVELEFYATRPDPAITPVVSKYRAETLYYPLTAPSFIGSLTGNASTATTLQTSRTIQTNLGSTSSALFNGSANITPGVTGTLPVGNGGTGETTAQNAANAFMNALSTGSSNPVDADYYISQYAGGGTTTTTYHRRPMSALWEYIKGKISSVLGLTNTNYGGSAATVNGHTVNSDVPSNAVFTDTSDYDALSNRPSINGTTLSGNKTAAQLGLATPSDIPTVPVQSVNGKTGAVVLSASDVGAGTYSKPSGGIPASDLTSAVQTSLGLADSALQSVPSTYRTAAAQDVIDAAQDAEIAQIPRPNLLDNWYFIGGGSQLGVGVFPINQKGQTSYSATGLALDRWKNAGKINIQASYVEFVNESASARNFPYQKLAMAANTLAGKECTISILLSDDVLYTATGTVGAAGTTARSPDINFGSHSFYLEQRSEGACAVLAVGASSSVKVKAVKLEIGSYQTLAHQENGTWVLNEIPDYNEQLQACQRYYIKFDRYIASGFLTNSGKEYNIPIYLPITMAGTPTVTMSGYVARTPNGYSAHTGGSWTAPTTLGVYFPNNGFVLLADTINSAVDTNNTQINYYIKDLVLTV